MPFTQYINTTFKEALPKSTALQSVLNYSSFSPLEELDQPTVVGRVEAVLRIAHDQPTPLALVDGILRNTPGENSNTFDPKSEFVALYHRVLTVLPGEGDVRPSTALLQVIFEERQYLGDPYEGPSPEYNLNPGDKQLFLSIHYSQSFGMFGITSDSMEKLPGTAIGGPPIAPNGVGANALNQAISNIGLHCGDLSTLSQTTQGLSVTTIPFFHVGKSSESDDDELSKFVSMDRLEFLDPMPKQRERLKSAIECGRLPSEP